MSKRSKGIIPDFQSLEEILEEAILHEQESHDYYLLYSFGEPPL